MNNSKKFKKENITPSNQTKNEIDDIVDKIIEKNKYKFNKSDEIDNNHFSLKDKKGNILYYLKKNSKSKDEKSETYSKKIIKEARSNLGEEEIEELEILDEIDKEIENKKNITEEIEEKKRGKIKIRFGKKPENLISDIQKKEDLAESEEFNKVISGIEKIQKIDVNSEEIDDAKILDEKIKEDIPKEKTDDIYIKAESKAKELAERHIEEPNVESNKKTDDTNQKIENRIESESIKSDEDLKLIDEQIKKSVAVKESSDALNIEEVNNQKNQVDKQIEKPYKSSPFSKLKNKEKEPIKKDETKIEKKEELKPIIPKFKVENIPTIKDEDQNIIDENIKKSEPVKESSDGLKIAENKAQILAKQHLKEESSNKEKTNSIDKKKIISQDVSQNQNLKETNPDQEHIFFDEDVTFSGWSPNVPEKDKKELEPKPEIDEDNFGSVSDIELPKEVLNIKSVKLSDLGFSEKEWEELDFYPLHEPFAYVEVLREKETLDKCYFLVEIDLNEKEEETINFIKESINTITIDTEELEDQGDDDYLARSINQVIKEYNLKVNEESYDKILYYLSKSSLGLDKIDPLMKDPNIEDISCDGSNVPLFLYHRKFGSLKSNIKFNTEEELSSFIYKLAQKCGKHISIAEPMLDATMPDGSRIQMTLSDEITAHGSTFTIRKFRSDPFSPPDLIEFNTMSSEMIAYMWISIEHGINMLFAGGTASGKTTTLNALSLFIPPESKIVSIEETREINLPHPNWIPGVARTGFGQAMSDKVVGEIDMYDLMKAALRQRPEYILVGEIRGREAYVLFQAMATGHATYSTVHADSAHSLIHRLEGKPINIPRVMLQSLDVVSLHVITKVRNKRARRCKQIIEIIDIDPTTKEILTNEVFRWDPVEDKFVYSGKSYILERIRAEKDFTREQMTEELKRRRNIVEHMNKNNIRGFRDVAQMVSRYLDNPLEVTKKFK